METNRSHAPCALCRRGHDPERQCSAVAGDEAGRLGDIVGERYQLVRLLGAGGMGVVYEARHALIGRRLAVKLLHPQYAQQASMLTRFQREARAAASLENEHIAAVTDFGFAADGAPYLVMERLEGEDLATLLERSGPLPIARAVSLAVQACRGLAAAHAADIVHRDLKPANLFLTRRSDGADLVKVLDFGIAKLRDAGEGGASITGTGKLLGTASYMPPEQARGESDIDHRADIYALGAIVYELLAGAKAHPGSNYNAVLFHILTQASPPLRGLRPDLPRGLDAVIERAMAPDRAARYASVTDLLDALAPFVDVASPAPARAPASGPAGALAQTMVASPTVEKPAARRRSRAWAIVAAIVPVLAAVVVAAIVLIPKQRPAIEAGPSALPTLAPDFQPARLPPPPTAATVTPPAPPPPAPAPPPTPAAAAEPKRRPPGSHRRKPPAAGKPADPETGGFDTRNPYE